MLKNVSWILSYFIFLSKILKCTNKTVWLKACFWYKCEINVEYKIFLRWIGIQIISTPIYMILVWKMYVSEEDKSLHTDICLKNISVGARFRF